MRDLRVFRVHRRFVADSSGRKEAGFAAMAAHLPGNLFDALMDNAVRLPRANQLQVIGLIGDRPMAKGAHNPPRLQEEHARHLVRIFLDHADSILEHRTLEPAPPNLQIQEVQERVGA